jgi:hypothetical protein
MSSKTPFLSTPAIIAIIAVFVVLTFLFYYFMYTRYRSGQSTCDALYPGTSLKNLRMREDCKDRKRGNWAMPASAVLLGSSY